MGRVQTEPAGGKRVNDEGWVHEHGREKLVIVADCGNILRL